MLRRLSARTDVRKAIWSRHAASACPGGSAGYAGKMSSELSPGEVRAAAEVHRELGPEYSDAVVESFLERVDQRVAERVDREVAARVDARLGAASRPEPVQPARSHSGGLTLLTGVAIGIFVTGVPSVMVAASGGGVLAKDESQALIAIAAIWVIVALVVALRAVPRRVRHRDRSA
jgi:hypothetical protein